MQVEFLGTAGYHPSATRHTSCAYLPATAPGCDFVLDAGTGMFRLVGRQMPSELHIFLSHAHLDHVSGLTYLLDIVRQDSCAVTVYGSARCLDTVRNDLFDSPLFPVPFRYNTQEVRPGMTLQIHGVSVTVHPLTHPGGSLAYRFDWPDTSLAYVTDTAGDERYIEFIRGVDLLIHERNFSDSLHELATLSGHCTSGMVVRMAAQAQVKRMAITHFDPRTENDPLEEDSMRASCPQAISAYDGLTVEF